MEVTKLTAALPLRILAREEASDDDSRLVERFLRVHRNMERFRGDSSFTTWLYRVVVNLAITELRRRTRSRTLLMEDIAPAEAWRSEEEAEDAPALHLELDEERETVQQVLRHL